MTLYESMMEERARNPAVARGSGDTLYDSFAREEIRTGQSRVGTEYKALVDTYNQQLQQSQSYFEDWRNPAEGEEIQKTYQTLEDQRKSLLGKLEKYQSTFEETYGAEGYGQMVESLSQFGQAIDSVRGVLQERQALYGKYEDEKEYHRGLIKQAREDLLEQIDQQTAEKAREMQSGAYRLFGENELFKQPEKAPVESSIRAFTGDAGPPTVFDHYKTIQDAPFFEEQSQADARLLEDEDGSYDWTYAYINQIGDAEEAWKHVNTKYRKLTGEEVEVYNYIRNTQGRKEAEDYLKNMEYDINERLGEAIANLVEISPVMTGRFSIASGVLSFFDGIAGWFSDEARPPSAVAYASEKVRNDLPAAARPFYDIGVSLGAMAPIIAVGVASGGTLAPATTALAAGASSGGHAYQDALRDGYDLKQALLYGAGTGLVEAATQALLGKVSGGSSVLTGKLSQKMSGVLKSTAQMTAARFGMSMLGEGVESYLETAMEPLLRNLMLGEKNDLKLLTPEALYNGFLGAVTGGFMEGIDLARNRGKNPFYGVYGEDGRVSVQYDIDGKVLGYLHMGEDGRIDGYMRAPGKEEGGIRGAYTYEDREGKRHVRQVDSEGRMQEWEAPGGEAAVTPELRQISGALQQYMSRVGQQNGGLPGLTNPNADPTGLQKSAARGIIEGEGGGRNGEIQDIRGGTGSLYGESRGSGEGQDIGRGKPENRRNVRETREAFTRRAEETANAEAGGYRRRLHHLEEHGNTLIAYKEKTADETTPTGRAVLWLRERGIEAVLTDGAFEYNQRDQTTRHLEAATSPDGKVFISSEATLSEAELSRHEAVHVLERKGSPLYSNYYEELQRRINGTSPTYIEIAGEINNRHYNGRFDVDDIDSFIPICRELFAYIHQFIQTDPSWASERFSGAFSDWDGVVEAIRRACRILLRVVISRWMRKDWKRIANVIIRGRKAR